MSDDEDGVSMPTIAAQLAQQLQGDSSDDDEDDHVNFVAKTEPTNRSCQPNLIAVGAGHGSGRGQWRSLVVMPSTERADASHTHHACEAGPMPLATVGL